MPVSQNRRLLDELEAQQSGRYIDLCLVLRHEDTKETLLWSGGRWDRLDRCWSKQEPETGQVVEIGAGQAPFVSWYATYLRDFREGLRRDVSLALAGGGRRGGKTDGLTKCFFATLVDVPLLGKDPIIGWLVSAAHSERDELDRLIHQVLLPGWFVYREWPKHVYVLAHGSSAMNISADDPETLKRGRTDIVLLNEAQKMSQAVLTNAIGGTADRGGIALLAANPPQRSKGEWVYDLQQDITSGEYGPSGVFFHFDPKLNKHIDQAAKSRVGKFLRRINPAAAEADEDGVWRRPGELAYEAFSRIHNIAPAPDLGDITTEFTKRRLGRSYRYLAGYDPNNRPHHVGVVFRIYGTFADPILWAVDEVVVDHADGEDHFLEVASQKYGPDDVAWILDNSCFWQDSKRRHGSCSADYFKKWSFRHEPNQAAAPNSKSGRPRNPDIELRVALLNKLLHSDPEAGKAPRLMVSPECKSLIEGFKNCKSKKVRHGYGPVGFHSHITDAAGYAAWWCFPRPGRVTSSTAPLYKSFDRHV